MKLVLSVSIAVFTFSNLAASQERASTPLERLLLSEAARIPAKVGIYVKHLPTGEEASVRADETFNSASTRKIPIMIMAFQQAEQHNLDLSERSTVQRSDLRVGTGVLQFHDPGDVLTLHDLITEMIITSDNTATDMVMRKLGGPESINNWMREHNYVTRTTWGSVDGTRHMLELLDPAYGSATDEEITALEYLRTNNPLYDKYADLFADLRQPLADRVVQNAEKLAESIRERSPEDQRYWTGSTTPREIGKFLESIERATAASRKSCLDMKHILLRQQLGVRRIPHFLNVPVAHKTGDIPPGVANDAGLVYAHSGVIVISIFTMGNTGPYADMEDQIGHIGQKIVDYFDGKS